MPSSPPVCDEIGYGCGYIRYVRYVGSNSNLYHAFIDDMSGIQIKLNCFQHNVDLTLASSMWTLCWYNFWNETSPARQKLTRVLYVGISMISQKAAGRELDKKVQQPNK